MNLDIFKQKLIKRTIKNLNWEEDESDGKDLYLRTFTRFSEFNKGCEICIHADSNATLFISYDFGYINLNSDTLKLINNYNMHAVFIHGYIDGIKDCRTTLNIEYSVFDCGNEDNMVEEFIRGINLLTSNQSVRYLEPLILLLEN